MNKRNLIIFSIFFVFLIILSSTFTSNIIAINNNTDLVTFPRDEYAHQNFQNEWWYFNAHLKDQNDKPYDMIQILFRGGTSTLILIDKNNNKYHTISHSGVFSKSGISSKYMSWNVLHNNNYQIDYNAPQIKSSFKLSPNKPPLLIGENGLIPFGKNGYSYYYSQTDNTVTGSIQTDKEEFILTGTGWIDRQWGNWTYGQDFDMWDWFSIQLDNGVDIAITRIVLEDEILLTAVNIINANNSAVYFENPTIDYMNNWTDEYGYEWSEKWLIGYNDSIYDIKMEASTDFKTWPIRKALVMGTGKVTGSVNNEAINGNMFFERHYFEQ